jgi:isoleucyl-tRNA synthetase
MFEVGSEASLIRIEEEVRRFWQLYGVPEADRAARNSGSPYVIYQQPLSVAGQSPADQVRLLATTDLLARYHAMQGNSVQRRAGWACHGLAVEVAVERAFGPRGSGGDLEQFAAACRQAAMEGVTQGQALAERLGVWLDPGGTYTTLSPQAIGTVWAALHRLWNAGRLKNEQTVASVCPRCATPLSTLEAGRRSVVGEARSAWVRLPWDGEADAYFLAWTEAPWMLVGMVALAVHPGASYVLVESPGHPGSPPTRLLLAESALDRAVPGDHRQVRRMMGKALRGARYRPLFTFLPVTEGTGRVVLSTEVPLDQGTGVFPVTPAFDAPSLAIALAHDLPVPEPLDGWGNLDDTVMPWRGFSPLDAERLLVEDLQTRGLLVRQAIAEQPRALCPYCETPLLPLMRSVWRLETESGPWIIGRDRAWGTPLPIWGCAGCGERACVAGLDDLAHRAGLDTEQIDPHRPAVDRIIFACTACGGSMHRVPVVVDVDFETAVLSRSPGTRPEPANLAVGVGATPRSWLANLTVVAPLLSGAKAWDQAVSVPEEDGGAGWDLRRSLPADAWRWAAYTGTDPELAEQAILRPLWRMAVELASSQATTLRPKQESGTGIALLERWLGARVYQTLINMSAALDASNPRQAAWELASFVDDLSGWYLPRQHGGGGAVIGTLNRMIAPFLPHLAEAIQRLLGAQAEDSVHLTRWPAADPLWADAELLAQMANVKRLAALGHMARGRAGLAPGQVVRQAIIGLLAGDARGADELAPLLELLADALGSAQVRSAPDAAAQVRWRLSLNRDQAARRAIALDDVDTTLANLDAASAARLASQLWKGFSVSIESSGQGITLLPEEVEIAVQAQHGWTATADAHNIVILETGDLLISVS